jgi:ABC-2 type transport system permease protein
MNSLRVFFIGGSISFRALFGWLSPWIYIPSLLVAPVFQILLFAYIGRQTNTNSDEFYVIGNALHVLRDPVHLRDGPHDRGRALPADAELRAGHACEAPPALHRPVTAGDRESPRSRRPFALVVGGLILGISVPASAVAPIALVILVTAARCTGLGLTIAGSGSSSARRRR